MSASESSSSSRHEVSENTPLLQARTSEQVAWPAAGDTRSEVRTLWSLYWPLWVTQLLDNAILIANVVFVGHLGVFELAAIQLSTSSVSVLGMSVIFGINCALDTLCNQAWTSENPKLVGLYAQKQLVIVSAILAPILILLFNAKPVLLLLRQDPEVAHLAAKCLKVHSLFLPFMAIHDVTQRYLAAQSRVRIATGVLLFACPLSVALNWALVFHYKLGLIGSPLATVITWAFMALAIVLYTVVFVPKDGWPGLSRKAFTGLGENIRLGASGVVMSMCDWIVWEAFTIAAGTLGPVSMAAQSILFTTQLIFFQSAIASSSAAAVRMGNCIGAGHPKQARLVLRILTIFALAVGAFNISMLVPNLGKVAHIFTNDADVVRLLQQVFPIVALYQIFDQCQGAFYGPFRGTGRLRESAVVVFVSFWVVGLPLAMILCFHSRLQLGLFGLWLGMAVGSAFAAIGEGSFVWFFINYEKEAIAGKLRSDAAADELNNDTTSRKTQVHANSP